MPGLLARAPAAVVNDLGERVDWMFTFTAAADNLVRLRTLAALS